MNGLVQPYEGIPNRKMPCAVTAVADRISEYPENETVLNSSGTS